MMKKRIAISSLGLLFLVSTTGLPFTYHMCKMMNKKSLSECEVCMVETREVEIPCCAEEFSDFIAQISASESTCCVESFTYKKIEDNFSQSINFNSLANSVVTILKPLDPEIGKEEKLSYQDSFNLPPPKFGKDLLFSIQQLKIALPVC